MHYGGRHVTDEEIRSAAEKHGVPFRLFRELVVSESGRDVKAKSPVGAAGPAQVMPTTGPPTLDFGAQYLAQQKKTFGSWRLALAAYNAGPGNVKNGKWQTFKETRSYVAEILKRAGAFDTPTANAGGTTGATATPPGGGTFSTPTPIGRGLPDLQEASRMGLEDLRSGRYDPTKALSDLAATARAAEPVETPEPAPGAYEGPGGFNDADLTPGNGEDDDWQRWVVRPPSVAGPSKPHGNEILQFVGRIGRRHGQALQPWPNESHSLTTVSGTPSAHGPGRAADIPAKGAKLRRLGYLALLEAGMPKKEALKAARKGGLYNVGSYQIIFATQIGGDHSDHLHVGIRG